MDSQALFDWLELLDQLDYYELLQIDRASSADDVRHAFYSFAESFHPDGHPGRPPVEQAALDTIFKRGTEAYAVLADPVVRARYDQQLVGVKDATPPRIQSVAPPAMGRASAQSPPKLEDSVRAPSARPFARRGQELVEKGDLKQAKLQLVMANHMDPGNDVLAQYLRHIEDELKGKR